MLRIWLEIDEENEYAADETKRFAESLSEHIYNRFKRKLNDIDSDIDWFVGFVNLSPNRKEEIKEAFDEWADKEGVGTCYRVEDMENSKEGPYCCDNNGVCEGCPFAFDGKEPCRIGCLYA